MTSGDMNDQELDRRLDALARQAEPDPALWQAIEARLDPDTNRAAPRTGRQGWIAGTAIAASLVGALALGLVLTENPGFDEREFAASAFQMELIAMRAGAPTSLASLLPDAPESLMAAWSENQGAIDELEQALERDPDNRLLMEFLTEARLRQARLLQHGLSQPHQRSIEL